MSALTRRTVLQAVLASALLGGGALRSAWAASGLQVFTSDWEITCLLPEADGVLWAGTRGGVARVGADGTYCFFTRADGLPSHETCALARIDSGVCAVFAKGAAAWDGTGWKIAAVRPTLPPASVMLPPGVSSDDVSARATDKGEMIVAIWGSGDLFWRSGGAWRKEASQLPAGVGEQITALAVQGSTLWAGTRRAGLWRREPSGWRCMTSAGVRPRDHNAQAVVRFDGKTWVSTLSDGLQVYDGSVWSSALPPVISSDAPRQLVVFQERLYVRHGSGAVDVWDGKAWTRNALAANLPHRQASALASDGTRLWVAQWGGFSVWDGSRWAHHLDQAALAGVPLTCLCVSPEGKTLWIGTQGRGLVEADAGTGKIRAFHDERGGLSDDWVTVLAQDGTGRLYVGTFVGGLAVRAASGGRFQTAAGTEGENVTSLAITRNAVYAATRHGVRSLTPEGKELPPLPVLVSGGDAEAQCLSVQDSSLWVGTRTGIYRLAG